MRKIITYILINIAFLSLTARTCYAESISEQSATIKTDTQNSSYDYRVENLREFLEKYNSPLAPYAEDFVAYADANGLDYRLVPAISGVESTFGKNIPFNSYNAYGWVNGNYDFRSWQDSIATVSSTLKYSYIDKGAVSIPQIAKRYAPPSSTWGSKVKYFVSKIDTLPVGFDI
ncbi:MAG: hypothetical protein ABSC49_02880 [Candidatus Microgenomates bacterium]|jgi:hypothetical protein